MNTTYIIIGIVLVLWISGNLYRRHKNSSKVIHVDKNRCSGCQRCIKRCRRQVLETVEDETGKHVVVKYPDKCTACGNCLDKCKFKALKLIERKSYI
ncbi:MAG: 4Fe-4S binding protein [Dysgonamonadaceae bacterium]|jgi:NAD-dependent dihydropyrimidine dehydrogenase PreA subunit|nr:4Fe-4S binding protein [Dysgonamonadaceae bacterium]